MPYKAYKFRLSPTTSQREQLGSIAGSCRFIFNHFLAVQKDLYTQQIDSFIKDAKFKTAKMYLDGWITQKTWDEGLTAPSELTNTEINEVLQSNRASNGL